MAKMTRKGTGDGGPDLLVLAFALIAERGWRGFGMTELARRADLPLAEVQAQLPDRAALAQRLARRLDSRMLDIKVAELDGLSPRERVFELLMRRFDAMAPFKEGLRVLARQAPGDLGLLAAGLCNLGRVTASLVDAAETGDAPAVRAVARKVLGVIYARAFRVWLDDDTPDLARTLAELDRGLQRAEGMARWVRGWRGGGTAPQAEPAPA